MPALRLERAWCRAGRSIRLSGPRLWRWSPSCAAGGRSVPHHLWLPLTCTYLVRVEHTDRTRTEAGGFVTFHTYASVLAGSDVEAIELACQLVGTIRHHLGVMVTGARLAPELQRKTQA